jgi:hypothetical protein
MENLKKVYVVHYSKFKDRYNYLSNKLSELGLTDRTTWVTEIPDPSPLKCLNPHFPLKIIEVSYSHEKILKDIVTNNHEYSLILEDDVLLELIHGYDVSTFVTKCLSEMKDKNIELSWPGVIPDPHHLIRFDPEDILYHQEGNGSRCCHAYIVTSIAAQKILDHFHYFKPVDHMYNDAISLSGLKSYYSKFGFEQGTIVGKYASGLRHLGI